MALLLHLAPVVQGLDKSTGLIALQWISVGKTNYFIYWIVIYQVGSVIHPLNNWGLIG